MPDLLLSEYKEKFPMRHDSAPEALPLLDNCAPDTRIRFLELSRTVSCPRGKLCLRARETNDRILFLLKGKAAVYNLTRCGKKKILFVLGNGSLINESLTGPVSNIYCETLEQSNFQIIRQRDLLALMEQDFLLTCSLLACQERKIWRLEHQLKNTIGSIYLERKLAAKLWKLARDFGIPTDQGVLIDMDLSITFLADLLGAPRETTSRVCRRLSDLGLIRMERKKVCIPDPAGLSRFYRSSS